MDIECVTCLKGCGGHGSQTIIIWSCRHVRSESGFAQGRSLPTSQGDIKPSRRGSKDVAGGHPNEAAGLG